MAKCDGWCTPLYIYLVLAVMMTIGTVRMHFTDPETVSVETVLMSILYKIFWSGVIYLLCASCHENWAWILLLIPFVFILLIMFIMLGLMGKYIADTKKYHK